MVVLYNIGIFTIILIINTLQCEYELEANAFYNQNKDSGQANTNIPDNILFDHC